MTLGEDPIKVEDVSVEQLKNLVNKFLTRRTCRECDETNFYVFKPGYNCRYDCKDCGAEDAIFT